MNENIFPPSHNECDVTSALSTDDFMGLPTPTLTHTSSSLEPPFNGGGWHYLVPSLLDLDDPGEVRSQESSSSLARENTESFTMAPFSFSISVAASTAPRLYHHVEMSSLPPASSSPLKHSIKVDYVSEDFNRSSRIPRTLVLDARELWRSFCHTHIIDSLQNEIRYYEQKDGWDDLGYDRHKLSSILDLEKVIYGIPLWVVLLVLFRCRQCSFMVMQGQEFTLFYKNRDVLPSDMKACPVETRDHILHLAKQIVELYKHDTLEDRIKARIEVQELKHLECVAHVHFEWEPEAVLGSGNFGTVFACKYPANAQSAMMAFKRLKCIGRPADELLTGFIAEVLIMVRMQHRNVMRVAGVCLDPVGYISDRRDFSLWDVLRDPFHPAQPSLLSPNSRVSVALNIASGLEYLHIESKQRTQKLPGGGVVTVPGKPHVIHGDIKASNVLVSLDLLIIQLTDFGLSTAAGITGAVRGGTLQWMAPELFNQGAIPTKKTDVYSFGILVYELLAEREPYSEVLTQFPSESDFIGAIQAGMRPNVHYIDGSQELQVKILLDVMMKCWDAKPDQRPEMSDVVALLKKFLNS